MWHYFAQIRSKICYCLWPPNLQGFFKGQKWTPKPKNRTNNTKEFSEQFEGTAQEERVFCGKSHQKVHPKVRKSWSCKFFGVPFVPLTFPDCLSGIFPIHPCPPSSAYWQHIQRTLPKGSATQWGPYPKKWAGLPSLKVHLNVSRPREDELSVVSSSWIILVERRSRYFKRGWDRHARICGGGYVEEFPKRVVMRPVNTREQHQQKREQQTTPNPSTNPWQRSP